MNITTENKVQVKEFCEKEGVSMSSFLDFLILNHFHNKVDWLAYKYREAALQADFYRSKIVKTNIIEEEKELKLHEQ